MDEIERYLLTNGIGEKTRRLYTLYIRHYTDIYGEDDVSEATLFQHLLNIEKTGSKSRYNNVVKALKWYVRFKGNTTLDKVKIKKAGRQQIFLLTIEEQKKLLEVAYSYSLRYGIIFHIALTTGVSASEVANLDIGDFMEDRLYIYKTRTDTSRYVFLVDSQLCENIRELIRIVLDAGTGSLKLFQLLEGKGSVINRGKAPRPTYLTQALRRFLKQAGIQKKLKFHHLRHTYATTQKRTGVDLFTIQLDLGHSDLRTTQGYVHTTDEDRIQGARKNPNVCIEYTQNEYLEDIKKLYEKYKNTDYGQDLKHLL